MNKAQEIMEGADNYSDASLNYGMFSDNKDERIKYMKEFREARAKLQAIADSIPVWISVSDRLPDDRDHYDFYNVNSYNSENGVFYVPGDKRVDIELKIRWTHWRKQSLPQPPKQSEGIN